MRISEQLDMIDQEIEEEYSRYDTKPICIADNQSEAQSTHVTNNYYTTNYYQQEKQPRQTSSLLSSMLMWFILASGLTCILGLLALVR